MIENEIFKFVAENYQVVFLYGLKIASDIQKELTKMRVEIDMIKERL